MSADFRNWYERVYPRLGGHGLWLRGGEPNTLAAEEYGRRPFRVLFSRLSTYRDTAESFTHMELYRIACGVKGVFPDLAYLPPPGDVPFFAEDKVPWLIGTGTKRGPLDFDLIGFSNAIVQELVNLPVLLKRSGIPLKKSERMADASLPLLILGGANALHSSVFWIDDPPVDGVFVGEAEEAIARILTICRDGKNKGEGKAKILKRLEAVPGFFLPEGRRKTARLVAFPEATRRTETPRPVPLVPERAGEGHLPISEGCPCFCTFCAESYDRKPYREYPADELVRRALSMKAAMGLDSLDLYSFSFNMHSDFYRILWELAPVFSSLGLKSQRLDWIAHDPGLLGFLQVVGKSSLTCGIEGISERLRRYLNKNLPDEVLGPGLKAVLKAPLRELKIFLIATGLEEEKDFEGLKDLVDFVGLNLQYTRNRPRIIFSVTPLVRFPWTPLEFATAFPVEHMKPIVDRMKSLIRGRGFEFRQAAGLDDYWFSQVLVRAADPRVAEALLRAIDDSGFVYVQEIPAGFSDRFRRYLAEAGLGDRELLRGAAFEASAKQPWSGIRTGVSREFLLKQYRLAATFREDDLCIGRQGVQGTCRGCGGCPDVEQMGRITEAEQRREFNLEQFGNRVAAARLDEVPVDFLVRVGERARGPARRFVGAALASAIMRADPDTVAGYRRYGGSFWDQAGDGCWIEGQDRVTLVWDRAAARRIEKRVKTPAGRKTINKFMGSWGVVESVSPLPAGAWELAIRSPFAFDGRRYLEPRALKHTLLKTGEGAYRFEFTRESLRKQIVTDLEYGPDGKGTAVRVVAGPKFEAEAFLREAFALPDPCDWVRIRATAELMPSSA